MKRQKRRIKLIQPRLQLKLTFVFLGLSASSMLLQFILFTSNITELASYLPSDGLVLVALDLHEGEKPPADFETATGVYYALSEVEDVGEGRRMAWYFQQESPHPA